MSDKFKLESAIPGHLKIPGLCPMHSRNEKELPYPTYVARFDQSVTQVVICYLGVQAKIDDHLDKFTDASHCIEKLLKHHPAGYWDHAIFFDRNGFTNHLYTLYWSDVESYNSWTSSSGIKAWWESEERETDGLGYFKEVIMPRTTHFETHYSTPEPEALGRLARAMSGEIKEHAYWGSMRDRIPASQTSSLMPNGYPTLIQDVRQKIVPHENLCVIRSGQNWSDADLEEAKLYIQEMQPSLEKGMEYLHKQGMEIGCFSNRYAKILNNSGNDSRQSFGLSFWRGLDDLEKWASSHVTHLRIFGAAHAYMNKLGAEAKLRTYHEVAIVSAGEQSYEYINCHPATGMLNAVYTS
ncbi:phenylacetaldoxime dehydratase family protein [Methylobacillus caricis]|uniref:phenylacetaldoxime dehydratase family protein n=1 Tax=Methylobacillus caricis TaxID=1971611 RepID=UPI001CFF7F50|nr:phenylacetaldoxime dehydratase family protein [Methylobacillus caricis]MCB5186628.1 phenylacetaldoxime dehydratase family protein [Methylobacillus caricis]